MHASDYPTNMDAWMRKVEATHRDLDARVRGVSSGYTAGNTVTTTDASGEASFLYGRTYAAAPIVVCTGGNDERTSVVVATVSGFTVRFRDSTGALIASGPVRCMWQALPATT